MKTNTNVSILAFTKSKTVHAVPMTSTQDALFASGEHIGALAADADISAQDVTKALRAALVKVKTPADRIILRRGFVSVYVEAIRCAQKDADNRFDYLARKCAASASVSRKAKATKETRGRKEKASAVVAKLSEKDVAARLVRVLAFIAEWQQEANDEDTLGRLGTLAKMANGAK